jgi:hypothetical protein
MAAVLIGPHHQNNNNKAFFTFRNHVVSPITPKYCFINTFPAPSFKKRGAVQQQYAQIV